MVSAPEALFQLTVIGGRAKKFRLDNAECDRCHRTGSGSSRRHCHRKGTFLFSGCLELLQLLPRLLLLPAAGGDALSRHQPDRASAGNSLTANRVRIWSARSCSNGSYHGSSIFSAPAPESDPSADDQVVQLVPVAVSIEEVREEVRERKKEREGPGRGCPGYRALYSARFSTGKHSGDV